MAKFVQEIFIHENDIDDETVKKEYTEFELVDLIAPTVLINLYYATQSTFDWVWQYTKKIKNEKWRKCRNYPGYEASDYGRIRGKDGLVTIYEKNYAKCDANYVKKLLEAKPETSDVGWLMVDIFDRNGKKVCVSVHQLVADAWLVKPGKKDYDVHHISNDGYDNSPYNLMYVLPEQHRCGYKGSLHSGRLTGKIIPFHYNYSGPRKRIM